MSNKIIVLSLPRCGSSIITNLISSAGYCNQISSDSKLLEPKALVKTYLKSNIRFLF